MIVEFTPVVIYRTIILYICRLFNILNTRDIPEIDSNLLPVVKKVLKTFSILSYGNFDEFNELRNLTTELSELKTLNLTELLFKV